MFMSSLHDLKVHSEGLVYSAARRSSKEIIQGRLYTEFGEGFLSEYFPCIISPLEKGLFTAVVKMSQECFQRVLGLNYHHPEG